MTRQEVIKHLEEWKECISSAYRRQVIDMAIEALSESKTGEWIKSNLLPHGYFCSNCDAPVMTDDIEEMLYCPNCGAKMKGGEK